MQTALSLAIVQPVSGSGGGGGGGGSPGADALLIEDGSHLLLEDGSKLLLE